MLKRLAPPLEFGSMHAILFQMSLIPLTMSRYSIAALSATNNLFSKFIPFNRMMRIHIYLGYVMAAIIFIATMFFFAFFGILCASGEQDFCDKFTSEIMITGYAILGMILIVVATSYSRYYIPYEVFYVVHHLVFILFIVTIVHTFDVVQRTGERQRSQTFKWFSMTLLYYVTDRLAMHFHHTYRTKLLECSAIKGNCSDNSRMLILKLKRPPLFFFRPGQFAYLNISCLDKHQWHPFSIASGPGSPHLEFYIEIFGDGSWTDRLWKLLEKDSTPSPRCIEVHVMGPCGTGLAPSSSTATTDFSHAVAIGTGTGAFVRLIDGVLQLSVVYVFLLTHILMFPFLFAGIVPILSLFKQHVRQIMRLAPNAYYQDLKVLQTQIQQVENAEEVSRSGSLMRQLVSSTCRCTKYESLRHQSRTDSLRDSIQNSVMLRQQQGNTLSARELRVNLKEFKAAAYKTTRSFCESLLVRGLMYYPFDYFIVSNSSFSSSLARKTDGVVLMGIMPVAGIGLIGFTISWNTVGVEIPTGWFEFLQAVRVILSLSYY